MAEELSDEQINELKEAFAIFDFSNDGTIEGRDLPALLRSLGHDPKVGSFATTLLPLALYILYYVGGGSAAVQRA